MFKLFVYKYKYLYQMYYNPKAHIAMNKYYNGLSIFIFTFLEIEETELLI